MQSGTRTNHWPPCVSCWLISNILSSWKTPLVVIYVCVVSGARRRQTVLIARWQQSEYRRSRDLIRATRRRLTTTWTARCRTVSVTSHGCVCLFNYDFNFQKQGVYTPGNPGNLLELFFPPGNPENLQSLMEIFWFSLRVCTFVINISYDSCISECSSTKYLAVNQHQLLLRLVISVSVS